MRDDQAVNQALNDLQAGYFSVHNYTNYLRIIALLLVFGTLGYTNNYKEERYQRIEARHPICLTA